MTDAKLHVFLLVMALLFAVGLVTALVVAWQLMTGRRKLL